MTDLQKAIFTSQRKRFLKIAFLLLLSIIGIPLLIYAVYTIYILLPYSKIMRLLQFHQIFQICCSKNGRRKESSPNCLPVVVDQQKSLIDVRFASPLHIHTYLSLCGFQSLAPISLSSSSSSTSSSSSCSRYMRATRILIVRDAYRSLTMASNHQRDYGYSLLLLLLVGLGESLETVACLGRSPTVWTEVLTPMSTRKDDQRC